MRVRIVCYEDVDNWILGKFALKMREELAHLSVLCDIAKTPDSTADINHHVIYIDYQCQKSSIDTVMITHIDADWKFRKLKAQMETAALGICMSADTMKQLAQAGIDANKLCFVNPAHDSVLKPRPYLIGLTSRIYPDGRKRERLLLTIAERVAPDEFAFQIMGEGWEQIVAALRARGFRVDYFSEFQLDSYWRLMQGLDYYLYLGTDEGAMGFVDALAAGVPTIATPQGYHLDAEGGLTHPFDSEAELLAVFEEIAEKRRALTRSVATWTWRDYAVKHRDLWEYLLSGKRPEITVYRDGLASLGAGAAPFSAAAMGKARLKFVGGSIRSTLWRRR